MPVGYTIDSQTNLLFTMDRIIAAALNDKRRVLSVNEDQMPQFYSSRKGAHGLDVVEVALSQGDQSAIA